MMGWTHKIVGNTVCEWSDSLPLQWKMSETIGKRENRHTISCDFDLAPLTGRYATSFLLELKELLMAERTQMSLDSVKTNYSNLRSLLRELQDRDVLGSTVAQIDEPFLLSLRTVLEEIPAVALAALKRLFTRHRASALFASGLVPTDFPIKRSKKGLMGDITSRILARALSRSACVEVLRAAEDAYEGGKIDIGHFSFVYLAFHVFSRPQSYRTLTVSDLHVDTDPRTNVRNHFLWITPAKTGTHSPEKISYQLNDFVGVLLEAQRVHVVQTYGHLVDKSDIGRLALFPARKLRSDGHWISVYARTHYGALNKPGFWSAYLQPIVGLTTSIKFNFNALRHTVGTHLAEAGCSAKTIQAVLKHASDKTCQAYVDIAYHGLIGKLSDTMKSSFEEHFPVFENFRSKADPVEPQKAIRGEDLNTGRVELTGECGRAIACQYAPLTCYPCPRFIPCYDADHSINLSAIEHEINSCEERGLPFRELLNKAKDIRRHIILVMAAADQKRNALAQATV